MPFNAEPQAEITSRQDGAMELVGCEVKDPLDAANSDGVELVVESTESPSTEIGSPEETGSYYSDQKLIFRGHVLDNEDDPGLLVAWWESDRDGVLEDVDADPDSSGEVLGYGHLSEGEHALELHVEDSTGKTGTASVLIQVGPPNSAPECAITAPQDGSAGEEGALVVFTAEFSDMDVSPDWLSPR